MQHRVVLLQRARVRLVLLLLQEEQLAVVVQLLIVRCKDQQPFAHSHPLYLVVIVVYQLDARVEVFAYAVFAHHVLPQLADVVVQVLDVQQIAFRTLSDGILHHLVHLLYLLHLAPEAMRQERTVAQPDGISAVQVSRCA